MLRFVGVGNRRTNLFVMVAILRDKNEIFVQLRNDSQFPGISYPWKYLFSMCDPHLQQDSVSPPQPHSPLSISLPLSAARIIAHAQPTPLCTSIAWAGQFRAHAPHSIHAAGCMSSACSFPSAKTPWGQTCVHRRQLIHFSG